MEDQKLTTCPICVELLVFPRGDYAYCEDCGWPDEDFEDTYGYPEVGEKLEKYQPGLEFFNGIEWVESGVNHAIQTESFRGLYRYKK